MCLCKAICGFLGRSGGRAGCDGLVLGKQKYAGNRILSEDYLFKAVKNRCLTLINRNELKQQIVNTLYADWQSQYEDPDFYVVEELTRNIEAALSRLPESYREAFEMNRFQNMTYNEIAQKLNVSSKTVDYRIQQALKLLRVELKDYLPLLMALVRIV